MHLDAQAKHKYKKFHSVVQHTARQFRPATTIWDRDINTIYRGISIGQTFKPLKPGAASASFLGCEGVAVKFSSKAKQYIQ